MRTTRSIARWAFLISLSWLFAGCDAQNPIAFDLHVEPNSIDPQHIAVVVEASDASAWRTFDRSPQAADSRESILAMRLRDGTNSIGPALLGDYEITGNKLRLLPRFPLLAGESYVATFDPAALNLKRPLTSPAILTTTYRAPIDPTISQPRLTSIYPSGDVVPANHLKFYLVFSEPMRKGEFLRRIKLIEESGTEVSEPFRETELWSEDERRLTLWFHPGRQKTGVNLNVELGPVLEPGKRYRLIISGDWRTQAGAQLGKVVEKPFTVGQVEHAQLKLTDWRVIPPSDGSRESLRVEFPKPLDWALLKSQIVVVSSDGLKVRGAIKIDPQETAWSFSPEKPWDAGEYQLNVGSVLEDLAGNSLARPFEVDLEKSLEPQSPEELSLKFTISSIGEKK